MVKKTEKASVKFGVSEYLRIRRYVMTRIMAYSCNTDEDPRIPSLQELSAKFKVSRPTVCKALKELINENYLIAKPGLGTYINPLYILEHDFRRKMPLVGLLLGDGLLVHIDIYYGEMFSGILRELVRIPCYVHQLSLSALSPDQVFDVIREESLDALCWIQPPQKLLPVVERLRVAGLPVVTCSADALTKEESRQKNDVYFGIEELDPLRTGTVALQPEKHHLHRQGTAAPAVFQRTEKSIRGPRSRTQRASLPESGFQHGTRSPPYLPPRH